MMRPALLALLLLLPAVAADGPTGWEDGGDGIERIGWAISADGVVDIHFDVLLNGTQEIRAMAFLGVAGQAEPDDWWLLHASDDVSCWHQTEAMASTCGGRDGEGVEVQITAAIQDAQCFFVVGQLVEWNYGYSVLDAVPDTETNLADAWRAGDLCDGVADTQPEPIASSEPAKEKESPLPVAVLLLALVLTARRNW